MRLFAITDRPHGLRPKHRLDVGERGGQTAATLQVSHAVRVRGNADRGADNTPYQDRPESISGDGDGLCHRLHASLGDGARSLPEQAGGEHAEAESGQQQRDPDDDAEQRQLVRHIADVESRR